MLLSPGVAGLALLSCIPVFGANFGTVVVTGGHASDLALEEQRGQLYIGNFGGKRVDLMATADNTLRTPIRVDGEPAVLPPAATPLAIAFGAGHRASPRPDFSGDRQIILVLAEGLAPATPQGPDLASVPWITAPEEL